MVLAVCVLLLVLDRQLIEQRILQRVEETSLAPGINETQVVEARIKNSSGETLLVKEGDSWKIRTPFDAQADPELVKQLLVNVTAARRNNELEVKNLAQYGLSDAEITLSLKTNKAQSFELQLGNESTYTGQVFARYPKGSTIFTVGDHVRSVLLRSPRDWRRARLIDVDTGRLDSYKRIELQSNGKTVELRADAGCWSVTIPVTTVAETDAVNDFLRKTGLLRATTFLTADSDKPTSMATALQALATPFLTVSLERADGTNAKLIVGKATDANDDTVYVAQRGNEPEIMVITASTFNDLNQDENHFRSRSIFSLKPDDVKSFSIEIGQLRTNLERNDEGKWIFRDNPDRRVDQTQVDLRLENLLNSRARDYVDLKPTDAGGYGFAPPQFRYTVIAKAGDQTEGLEVGKRESGNVGSVFARRMGDQAIFSMDLSPELVISPEAVADRKFARMNPASIHRFDVENGGKKYSFKREGNEWMVQKPGQPAFSSANAGRVQRIVSIINELEFDRDHAAKGETVIAPPDPDSTTLSFFDDKETQIQSLRLGKRLAETTYVTTNDRQTYDVGNRDVDSLSGAIQTLLQ
jgi:hypothetical protein